MLSWKPNWEETRRHFDAWWQHEGLIISCWGAPQAKPPHELVLDPGTPPLVESYTEAKLRAQLNHYNLSRGTYPADNLPIASTDIGPGSLALYIGAEPGFSRETVWYIPSIAHVEHPEKLPPLRFDPENHWWKITEVTAQTMAHLSQGKYVVGFPDLIENVDILSALRDPQTLMMDMIERPEWVLEKINEINIVYFEVFQRLYDIIKLPDDSSVFGAFALWGSGKTAKVQCDASAMFSPDMFNTFVTPALTAQCAWLDHSMYHLDGTQCICHLDHLLAIETLDAIEWTPQSGIEQGGDPRWYPLYQRILDAGKSVQIVGVTLEEVIPLLDKIGGKGVYIMTSYADERSFETLLEKVEQYRG